MDKMQPPSGFSFVGLAEAIKEIRELVKDMKFRNKHEEAMSSLDVAEKYRSSYEKNILYSAEISQRSEPPEISGETTIPAIPLS